MILSEPIYINSKMYIYFIILYIYIYIKLIVLNKNSDEPQSHIKNHFKHHDFLPKSK